MEKKAHTRALKPHPGYPERFQVPLAQVLWEAPFPEYAPVDFTAEIVRKSNRLIAPDGWADPDLDELSKEDLSNRLSFCGRIELDEQRRAPRNPMGRTGMIGRGLLGKWGPNHTALSILTRFNPDNRSLEMVATKQSEALEWLIPGGFVLNGSVVQMVSEVFRRIFGERGDEGWSLSPEINLVFQSGIDIYRGYFDDARNTDNSWIEAIVVWFHTDESLGNKINFIEIPDTVDSEVLRWLPLDDTQITGDNKMDASHAEFVQSVISRMRSPQQPSASTVLAPVAHNSELDLREEHERNCVMAFVLGFVVVGMMIVGLTVGILLGQSAN
eukprot:c11127_g1_i2.p1 GENE.c11127_g1_i2~~c11127_g1_i2.p1  ORF type:complete len:328 (+),score=67.90 c11127_g1_i2:48-1031(+)